jgi:hypothetical protein
VEASSNKMTIEYYTAGVNNYINYKGNFYAVNGTSGE